MDISRMLSVVAAHWRAAVLTLLLVLASAVVLHFALPPRYTATAAIVLDVRGLNPVRGLSDGSAVVPRTVLGTQASMVRSDGVARQVVRRLDLVKDPRLSTAWHEEVQGRGDAEAWIARKLLKSLDVRPDAEDSNVLDLHFSAPDPRQAAQIANAFSDAYLATALALRSDPARVSAAFFTEQVKTLGTQLEAAQVKLSNYQRANGIVGGDERLDVETASLNELSLRQIEARAKQIEASSRSQKMQGRAADSPDVLSSPVVQQLLTRRAEAQAQLKAAQGTLGPRHPKLLALENEVAQVRSELEREFARAAASLRMNASINEQRESALQASVEAQRKRVLQLKTARDGMAVLERDVDTARKAYDQAQLRLVQTSQEGSSPSTEASVLTVAVPPAEQSRPGLKILLPLGVVLGAALALLVALALDHRRPAIHYPADLVQWEVPLLAVVPDAHLPVRRLPYILGAPT